MGRDISRLHPRLQGKVAQLQKACEKAGLALGIGECFRSAAEQDALYAQGRTSPGAIVTNAPAAAIPASISGGSLLIFLKMFPVTPTMTMAFSAGWAPWANLWAWAGAETGKIFRTGPTSICRIGGTPRLC